MPFFILIRESAFWFLSIIFYILYISSDLLNPDHTSNKMEVKMKLEGGLHVPGLTSLPVHSVAEINKVIISHI